MSGCHKQAVTNFTQLSVYFTVFLKILEMPVMYLLRPTCEDTDSSLQFTNKSMCTDREIQVLSDGTFYSKSIKKEYTFGLI